MMNLKSRFAKTKVMLFTFGLITCIISCQSLYPQLFIIGPGICEDGLDGIIYTLSGTVVSNTSDKVVTNTSIEIASQKYGEDPELCYAPYSAPQNETTNEKGEFYFHYFIVPDDDIQITIIADGCDTFTQQIYNGELLLDEELLSNLTFELDCD